MKSINNADLVLSLCVWTALKNVKEVPSVGRALRVSHPLNYLLLLNYILCLGLLLLVSVVLFEPEQYNC